jgi:2-polyprenyl-3-methyl-5-hydroxy-6-metoxy-1,4-benzoquinol methylase
MTKIIFYGVLRKRIISILSRAEICFLRRLCSDSTLGLQPDENALIKLCQLKASRSVYADRFYEWREFYGISIFWAYVWFIKTGWPFSARLQNNLMLTFEGNTAEGDLFKVYEKTTRHYSAVLMLSMHRVQWIWPFLGDIKSVMDLSKARVLEYGCGVSDFGLLFARLGSEVTIVDLINTKFDFTKWRYQVRGLSVTAIGVGDTESIPSLKVGHFDLVLATEILEHVRNPLAVLRVLTESLKIGGVLFSSMGLSFEREIGGDHLPVAAEIGNSEAYKRYFQQHYQLLATRAEHPWLFVRVQ